MYAEMKLHFMHIQHARTYSPLQKPLVTITMKTTTEEQEEYENKNVEC